MWVGDRKAPLDAVDPDERTDRAWGIVNQPPPRSPPAPAFMPTTLKETIVRAQVESLTAKPITERRADTSLAQEIRQLKEAMEGLPEETIVEALR